MKARLRHVILETYVQIIVHGSGSALEGVFDGQGDLSITQIFGSLSLSRTPRKTCDGQTDHCKDQSKHTCSAGYYAGHLLKFF